MPVCRIEAPPGIGTVAKKKMMEKITAAIDEAYHIGEAIPRTGAATPALHSIAKPPG